MRAAERRFARRPGRRRASLLSRLVLASASPRRQALIGLLGLDWRAAPASIDEAAYALDDPFVSALHIAVAKARAIATLQPEEVVLSADTLVIADGDVLGKPRDADAARAVLRRLRARAHQVATGVALRTAAGQPWGAVVSTRVEMRNFTDAEIDAYVASDEPFDKAGGYAIQAVVFRPVERIDGCYLNVVGLPLCAVAAGLTALQVEVQAPEPSGRPLIPPCAYCRAGAGLVAT